MENKKTRKKEVFETENKYYNYNIKIMRLSGWIRIDNICITKRSKFWDYADSYTEENGKRFIDVFRFNDRLYCLGQFERLIYPMFYEENGEKKQVFCLAMILQNFTIL